MNSPIGYVSLVLATLFWGGNFVLGRVLSADVPPLMLTLLRWLPAMAVLWLLFARPTRTIFPQIRAHWRLFWALGLLGIVLFPATLYQGLKTTTALNASLYLAVVPVLVILLNRVIYREAIKPQMLSGAILSTIGVLVLLSRGEMTHLLHFTINRGDLWAMGSALSWAVYCALIRQRPAGIANTAFLTALVSLGVISVLPFALWEMAQSGFQLQQLTPMQWGGIGYLIVFPSLLSYGFWNFGIALLGSSRSAVMTNCTPLFSALLSIAILNEALAAYHGISAACIVIGILLCNLRSKKQG